MVVFRLLIIERKGFFKALEGLLELFQLQVRIAFVEVGFLIVWIRFDSVVKPIFEVAFITLGIICFELHEERKSFVIEVVWQIFVQLSFLFFAALNLVEHFFLLVDGFWELSSSNFELLSLK